MNKTDIEKEIVSLLRDSSLAGSRREITLHAVLGEQGLGLDSLALTQFIVALENRFGIEFPETIWIERGQLKLQDLIDIIAEIPKPAVASVIQKHPQPAFDALPQGVTGTASAVREKGYLSLSLRILSHIVNSFIYLFYREDSFYILSFDLVNQPIPNYEAPESIVIVEASPDDISTVQQVWHPSQRNRKTRSFKDRLALGHTCYVARTNGTVAAIDWMASTEIFEPTTAIKVKFSHGSCYGFDLIEHPDYRGRAIGLAMLTYCLRRNKEDGFKTHYTIVHSDNEKMLLASIQLIGFKQIGQIITKRFFKRPYPGWKINNQSGAGRELTL